MEDAHGLPVEDAHAFYERSTGRVLIDGLTLEQCVFGGSSETSAYLTKGKRAFDLIVATLLLILATPIIALVSSLCCGPRRWKCSLHSRSRGAAWQKLPDHQVSDDESGPNCGGRKVGD